MSAKIAVVEDNPDNRFLVQALLEDSYELSEYETGVEAVEGLGQDLSLPEMDGTEVLSWIRQQPELKDIPVIALTAHAMAGDREKYLSAGFDEYVTKPILDEELLVGAIERCLSRSS